MPETIVNTGSNRGLRLALAARCLQRGLAADLAPLGIAVASVHPEWVKTAMGGPEADIETQESVVGLYHVLSRLTIESSGHVFNDDGTRRAFGRA